ncbi:GNAT family N-acetyltransferase [Tumebacillus avium]|uniref:GNAT family N-acetyltransferase n=1 Tax=Tumebacillus avium TaxID=1903704 RepID=A0A1Y0ILF9_9BACL|nr:arsinothricin resistance N-acetyltransferase ArsN1 family A [Tumebacillus avium]ARU61357.1 GNAT family N-acetyltransferase [Tumebacillus avium]
MTVIRRATAADLEHILRIYNQGIEDRIATLETEPKTLDYMLHWFTQREERYFVLIAETAQGEIAGWASVNPYSPRLAYRGVADLSIYIDRAFRGHGIGKLLLAELESQARAAQFHKIVLFTFPFNALGQSLYRKAGFREVGVFHNQGQLDGKFVDVMAMEKLL